MKKFAIVFALSVLSTNAFSRDIQCVATKYPGVTFLIRVSENPGTLKNVEGRLFGDLDLVFGKNNPATITGADNTARIELISDVSAKDLGGVISGRQSIVGKLATGEDVNATLDILAILKTKGTGLNKNTVLEGNARVSVTTIVANLGKRLEVSETKMTAMSCKNLSDFDLDSALESIK